MAGFYANPEAAKIAQDLIEKHHAHLKDATIVFLNTDATMRQKGQPVLGKATKTQDLLKYFTEADFIVLFQHEEWNRLHEHQRKALVDHELCHCGSKVTPEGETVYRIVGHDIEEFLSVIERHGLYRQDTKDFAHVAAFQLELLGEAHELETKAEMEKAQQRQPAQPVGT